MAETVTSRRVLVIDDLVTMRDLISRVLRASGYEVDVAGTVAQAMAMRPTGYDVTADP